MAKVVRFHSHGGPEVLHIEDVEVPRPGPGEVRISVKALGLNRAEASMRKGTYIETPSLPSGLGLEAAGIVETVGDGVDGFAPGDAVSIIPPRSMARWPAYGELVTFPAGLVVKHPPALGFEAAAATWMQYLTAYGALIDIAHLDRDEPVVITAASSSVGLAAIQIANRIGAVPIAITRTSVKKAALFDAGAAYVVALAEEDLEERLKAIAPLGVRVVLDAVGGPIFTPLTASMAHGGILIEYGGLSPEPTPFPLSEVLAKTLTLRGYLVHEITGDQARLKAGEAFILDGLASGALKPIVARTFPFEKIVEAHRYLELGEQFGKIVVTI
ncbi:NADPH:quinone reductase [Mesorhizobium sp. M2D.F.Ca.ET.185.01.1.1]|uniref:zinc-dependent alcohol dehydrogenase family protein n=1 Tax=unclassified Mesorhizobium TaxID=325217 RepID=UPI000FCAB7EE|nr:MULTISPECIES: zinc-dependent alcohol dehydrogenase family protein [unclassified Mesorhizobium]TGP75036.1 NADPH:quinone reductase [bacterium M00.F.Ca.ET.227.01.1.1]TGP85363.1 NADPH:quinone reductase [bacterium M00.F.Ca.ET.221.01.1.1]TGP89789.1 NADPH:quinone reductase [bacterium M00.F.Ca.ET.222.01.1.1]TGU05793.1 NADPH:quinone reductase [bacterium M00.F.Ca.ET.163.01.1.1]TGU25076.1 NADPH:quinone reductase [bacterium M00.F.Ca.ET.156.01.1.1]TGU43597.1 NADPH:quinone reductase [bacterium M00.F.Ca.